MPSSIIPFLFETDHLVRVAHDQSGAPLFVAADVCRILGMRNASHALSDLDSDEKGIVSNDTLGGVQEVLAVTESGLYALIMRSRKPAAKNFRKWVTSEVLPSIRKTGGYQLPGAEPLNASLPFAQWSNETKNTNLRLVQRAEHLFGEVAGADMWERLGFPMPHPALVRQRRQFELWASSAIDSPAQ